MCEGRACKGNPSGFPGKFGFGANAKGCAPHSLKGVNGVPTANEWGVVKGWLRPQGTNLFPSPEPSFVTKSSSETSDTVMAPSSE